MPKIKVPETTFGPQYKVPRTGVEKIGVAPVSPHRPVPSGTAIEAQIYGDLSKGVGDVAKYLAVYEARTGAARDATEVRDRVADLEKDLQQHYIDNVVPRKSGGAKDLFRHEAEVIDGMKDTFIREAEGSERLQQMLSAEFDAVAKKHLGRVFEHKIKQDEVYREDTAIKVAKNIQTEMSTLGLRDSGKALELSNKIDEQLQDYPNIREKAKTDAWAGMFKFNARMAPELTQKSYENETMRKNIVGQIGFAGYDAIQESIDIGRRIGIQDKKLGDARAEKAEDERIETHMSEAMHLVIADPDKFTTNYVDKLPVPSQEKRILNAYLGSLAKHELTDAEVDYTIYGELLESVRRGKASGLGTREIQSNIIGHMNRTITNTQGQSMLKALSNRDVFDKPTIQAAYDKLENMYKFDRSFENQIEYGRAIQSLTDTVLRYDGDPKKVQEFMQDVLESPTRKGDLQRMLENLFPRIVSRQPEFKTVPGGATQPYMTDFDREAIEGILLRRPTKKGRLLTIDELQPGDLQQFLDFVRSDEYIREEEKRAK